jgi:hypothetical protein
MKKLVKRLPAVQNDSPIMNTPGSHDTPVMNTPEPVVIDILWRISREEVHSHSAVSREAAPMLHVFSSYKQSTC